jgi:hypothetical protein
MLQKIAAVWLLALALSPFTTPFSTCDLQLLFSNHSQDVGASPSGHSSLAMAPSEVLSVAASTVPPLTGRVRLVALGSAETGCCPLSPRVRAAVSPDIPLFLSRHDKSLSTTLRI